MRTQWTGTLTIGSRIFTAEASAVFEMLRQLDRKYRETMPAATSAPAAE